VSFSPLIDQLITALRCLPGVGPKSAQRMVFYLLEHGRNKAVTLAECLQQAMAQVHHCSKCHTFSENDLCNICANPKRDQSVLCIVESPADVLAIEQTGSFRGLYFVLMGHLSPLDGIGPGEIGIDALSKQLEQSSVKEVIIATNPTVEGEATAYYIAELIKPQPINVTRIAHGVPVGSELEFIDSSTLTRALLARKEMA